MRWRLPTAAVCCIGLQFANVMCGAFGETLVMDGLCGAV